MSNQNRSHKRVGLSSTLSICFYCGEETSEITPLGVDFDDEAQMHLCTCVEPCSRCKERYKDCVLVVETRRNTNNGNKPQPTGRWVAINKACVTAPNNGICFTDPATMDKLWEKAQT